MQTSEEFCQERLLPTKKLVPLLDNYARQFKDEIAKLKEEVKSNKDYSNYLKTVVDDDAKVLAKQKAKIVELEKDLKWFKDAAKLSETLMGVQVKEISSLKSEIAKLNMENKRLEKENKLLRSDGYEKEISSLKEQIKKLTNLEDIG